MRFLLLIILSNLFVLCHGQLIDKYVYSTHYGIEQGLESPYVKDIFEDENGFIWLGTNNGIIRFDGYNFKTISKKKPLINEPYSGFTFRFFNIDNDLWHTGSTLCKMNINTHQWQTYSEYFDNGKKIKLTESFCVYKDQQSNLWLSTPYAGLCLFNKKLDRFESFKKENGEPYNWITAFFENENKELIFTESKGIYILKDKKVKEIITWPMKQNRDFRIHASWFENNRLWMNIDGLGFYMYDFLSRKWEQTQIQKNGKLEPLNDWNYFRIDPKEKINDTRKIINFSQLQLDLKNNVILEFIDKSECPSNLLIKYKTKDGNLWMGTTNGLYKFPRFNNHLQGILKSPSKDNLLCHYFDSSSNELYGINHYISSYLFIQNLKTGLTKKVDLKRSDMFPNFLFKINEVLFIVGKYSIFKFENNQIQLIHQIPIHNNRYVNYLYDYNKGKLLLSSTNNKFYIYDVNTHKCDSTVVDTQHITNYRCVARYLKNGHIIVAYALKNYLKEYDENGKYIRTIDLPKNTVDENGGISNICITPNESIWFEVNKKGVFELEYNSLKLHSYFQPTYFDMIECRELVFDNKNHIWAFSQEGIFKIHYLYKHVERVDKSLKVELDKVNFSLAQFVKGKIIYNSGSGSFIFQSLETPKEKAPYLFAEELKIMGQATNQNLFANNLIQLAPGENSFSFDFGVCFPKTEAQIKYFIKMEGYDNDWIPLSTPQVNYIGLSPGNYQLHIKAISINGDFSDSEKIFNVNIQPLWYQTNWFKILLVLFAVLLIYLISRWIIKSKLQKQKAENDKLLALEMQRNRIARDMHDDIGAGLSKIKYLSQAALDKTDTTELEKILILNKTNSDELVDKMNDIIWSLNNKEETLEELIIRMRSSFGEWINDLNKEFTFDCPEKIPHINLTEISKRNIYLSVKEALNNSVKYSNSNQFAIKIELKNTELIISIIDYGKGFDVEKMKFKGNGISNIYKRINELKGSVSILSNSNGTSIIYSIPI